MKILSIDPGYDRCGVAVVSGDRSRPTVLFSDCLRTSAALPFHARLESIGSSIEAIVRTYEPTACAIERLYFNTNQKTAMMVAEVRGAIIYIALASKLPVYEYTPLQIKQAVAGYGKADKKQIMAMIPRLVDLPKQKKAQDDEYDAIAVGITALASIRI